MGIAQSVLDPLGFDVSCYDFSPVPLTHDGQFILPTVYSMHNTPADMVDLWCDGGYYDHDPGYGCVARDHPTVSPGAMTAGTAR